MLFRFAAKVERYDDNYPYASPHKSTKVYILEEGKLSRKDERGCIRRLVAADATWDRGATDPGDLFSYTITPVLCVGAHTYTLTPYE